MLLNNKFKKIKILDLSEHISDDRLRSLEIASVKGVCTAKSRVTTDHWQWVKGRAEEIRKVKERETEIKKKVHL